MDTQKYSIANWLKAGNSLTPLEALNRFGTLRLGARVFELKRDGLPIITEMVEVSDGKRVASYRLAA